MPPSKPRPGFPMTPCINICTLDADDSCLGCLRTLDEIMRWSTMSPDEQWQVMRELELRRTAENAVPGAT